MTLSQLNSPSRLAIRRIIANSVACERIVRPRPRLFNEVSSRWCFRLSTVIRGGPPLPAPTDNDCRAKPQSVSTLSLCPSPPRSALISRVTVNLSKAAAEAQSEKAPKSSPCASPLSYTPSVLRFASEISNPAMLQAFFIL